MYGNFGLIIVLKLSKMVWNYVELTWNGKAAWNYCELSPSCKELNWSVTPNYVLVFYFNQVVGAAKLLHMPQQLGAVPHQCKCSLFHALLGAISEIHSVTLILHP